MKTNKLISHAVLSTLMVALTGLAVTGHAALVTIEAESGVVGSDFTNGVDGKTRYISVSTDIVNPAFPGNSKRVVTFNVNFPKPDTYDLYARLRVGPKGPDDDSLFYASGFGAKSPTSATDWIKVNNLYTGGFTATNDVVAGIGTAGIGVWKWVNLSQFTNSMGGTPITFTVTPGKLAQTFQIGGREDGLDMGKFVFGTSGTALTVADLDGTSPPPKGTPPLPKGRASGKPAK